MPIRMCAICRGRFAKGDLDRYVSLPDGTFQLDERRILPGRGVYCCHTSACKAKFANYKLRRKKGEIPGQSQGEI